MAKVALVVERGGPKTGCFGGPPRQILVEAEGQTYMLPTVEADGAEAGAQALQASLSADFDVEVQLGRVVAQLDDLTVYEAEAADALELPDTLPHANRATGRRLLWRSPAELHRLTPSGLATRLGLE